ncbi:MAG: PQQ-binding-like beta-propeller repeat protein [Thermoguttaceae bacterium]
MSDQITQPSHDPQSHPEPRNAGPQTRLRLWPGIVLVAALWLVRAWASIGEFAPSKFFFGLLIAPLIVLVGLLLWWLLASRLRWSDRWLVVGTFAVATAGAMVFADASFPGVALVLYALPIVVSAWLGWLVLAFLLPWPVRRAGILLIFIAAGAVCSLLRIDGANGDFVAKFDWRWAPTPEQRFLAELKSKPMQQADVQPAVVQGPAEIAEQPGDWPGFRGPRRDSRLLGVRIKTDWEQSRPQELWRHRIGPGWSSFAVVGDRLFTQEQRGEDECVVCYDVTKGTEVWAYHDAARFSEMVAGPGPRATPTFHVGRLYSFGASGHLNCLDAASGKSVWSRDIIADSGATVPRWGFASSPLVAQGLVVVFAGAPNGKTLVAYKAESGELAWMAGAGPVSEKAALSYCSPQLATINGVDQILLATDAGLSGFGLASGKEIWHYSWPVQDTARIVQPALVGDGDVLIGTGMGNGTRRIHVRREAEDWFTEEQWTTRKIKPYFNDFIVLKDHLYGFDGNKFVCINLQDGSEAWSARGYGNGQVLLLADQELLLILSEEGDVALVSARPEGRKELCRFKAIDGKTWNHPVIAHGKLFVRNGEEIACFKLAMLEEGGVPLQAKSAQDRVRQHPDQVPAFEQSGQH